MSVHIPKWIVAAFVGAAPMLGIVFLILFSCTLLGLVQRCKISLSKNFPNRRKSTINDRSSLNNDDEISAVLFNPISNMIIVSPFDDIPMRDIDAETSSKAYSEAKDDLSSSYKLRRNRSFDTCRTGSDYENGSSSIFNDNDYEQDRLSLIEPSSQRKTGVKPTTSPDTIINV